MIDQGEDMSRGEKTAYIEFYKSLKKAMRGKTSFEIADIYIAFPDMHVKTVSWYLYKLVRDGKITRVRHGVYSLQEAQNIAVRYDQMQIASQKLYDEMQDYGYPFCISGIDALIGKMQHVPEQYPVIMVVEKKSMPQIREKLITDSRIVVSIDNAKMLNKNLSVNKVDVMLLYGKNYLSLSLEGIAYPEKGFVDLYYAVTRMKYPISPQELSRIFDSLVESRDFSRMRMLDAAKDSGITDEIKWLLGIAKMPDPARQFAKVKLIEATGE